MASHDRTSGHAPERLAQLIRAAEGVGGDWQPGELAGILTHQLRAPVEFETRVSGAAPETHPRIQTFQKLFASPQPPLELLQLTKDFAKAHYAHPESGLFKEVAATLYFAAIALALIYHQTRISKLDDGALRAAFAWCVGQPWMHPALVRLFQRALGLKTEMLK